ncbi:MAG TPA: acyltransferase domain-containing protein [Candidatus Limnocylindria bacterium]|nr:acyltransferase domain-containing protein [Candidatus Limnocylindria bacterium]
MNRVSAAGPSRFGDEHRPWLDALVAAGPPPRGFHLPELTQASAVLDELGVERRDAAEIIAAWPGPVRDSELWWLLERAYHLLVRDIGGIDVLRAPSLPGSFGAAGRFFWTYVFLAALGDVREYHERRGIPREVSDTTLADLGRNLSRDRRLFGEGGLRTHGWLTLHFRGAIYELGRLQFNRMHVRATETGPGGPREGDHALGVHIPEGGQLASASCDASFGRAREFFARHFSETPARIAICTSWLLDEQLADYLEPGSNILRFQRRFRVIGGYEADADILRFVFGRIAPALDELPERTTLERAVVAHLRAGKHWRNGTGWLEL